MQSPNYEFVTALCRQHNVNPTGMRWIEYCYAINYDAKSDGISLVSDLSFEAFDKPSQQKHPAGVVHDYLYWTGAISRKSADIIFRDILIDFGHPIRAWIRYYGLRAGGWYVWNKCRKADHERKNQPRPH